MTRKLPVDPLGRLRPPLPPWLGALARWLAALLLAAACLGIVDWLYRHAEGARP